MRWGAVVVVVLLGLGGFSAQRASASVLVPLAHPLVYGFAGVSALDCVTITQRDDRSVAGYETTLHKTVSVWKFHAPARLRQEGAGQVLAFRLTYQGGTQADVTMTRAFLAFRRPGARPSEQGTMYWRIPYKTCARWAQDMDRP